MARFAKIGVGAGKTFDASTLSPEMKTAIEQGMADAWADLETVKKQIDTGKVTSGELFGTREYLKNNYLYRMAAAVLGIYGNSKQEAMYPAYAIDAEGQKLDGANRYTVHFAADQMPPVNAFWSLTMYDLPQSLLVDNPINRYLLNSPMLPQFVKDADGGLTFYVQNEIAGQGQGAELAACAQRPVLRCDAALLAEGGSSRRLVEASTDDENAVTKKACCRTQRSRAVTPPRRPAPVA